jgi:hypothetical protein
MRQVDDVLRFVLDAFGFISYLVFGIVVVAAVLLLMVFILFWTWTESDIIFRGFLSLYPLVFWTGIGVSYWGQVGGIVGAAAGCVFLWVVWAKLSGTARAVLILSGWFLTTALIAHLAGAWG